VDCCGADVSHADDGVFVVVCFCCGHAAGASSGAAASTVKIEEVEDSIPSDKNDLDEAAENADGEGWKSQDEPGGTFDKFGLSPEQNSPSIDQLLEDMLEDLEGGATIDEKDAGEEDDGGEEEEVHSEDQEFKLERRAERNYAPATQRHGGMVSFAKRQAKRRRTVINPREPKGGADALYNDANDSKAKRKRVDNPEGAAGRTRSLDDLRFAGRECRRNETAKETEGDSSQNH
jgi:hypothetical protein